MADPVADFLAREQDIMAEIEGSAAPAPADVPVVNEIVDDFGDMTEAAAPTEAAVPELAPVESSEGNLAALADNSTPFSTMGSGMNGHSGGAQSTGGSNSSKGPSPVPSMPRIEAENIRIWREQQRVLLEKKDEAEEKKKEDWRSTAKKEVEEWYKQREAALKGTHEANRKLEEEHVAAFGREQGENAQWDEIAKLCEAKAQKGGKDVSRLKSLLLHLKEQNQKKA